MSINEEMKHPDCVVPSSIKGMILDRIISIAVADAMVEKRSGIDAAKIAINQAYRAHTWMESEQSMIWAREAVKDVKMTLGVANKIGV